MVLPLIKGILRVIAVAALLFAWQYALAADVSGPFMEPPLLLSGVADAIQLKVIGNSTQTNSLFQVTKSDGTNFLAVANGGTITSAVSTWTFDNASVDSFVIDGFDNTPLSTKSLNCTSAACTVTGLLNMTSTVIGGGSPWSGATHTTVSLTPGANSLAAQACSAISGNIAGACIAAGDACFAEAPSLSGVPTAEFFCFCPGSAANLVMCNVSSAGPVTPPTGTYGVWTLH